MLHHGTQKFLQKCEYNSNFSFNFKHAKTEIRLDEPDVSVAAFSPLQVSVASQAFLSSGRLGGLGASFFCML
jgi:hypothetical protein